MHSDLNDINAKTLQCDICIIGTGPAGLSIISKLLKKRKKIILIESGNIEVDGLHDELNYGHSIGPRYLDLESSRIRTFGGAGKIWAGVCRHFSFEDFKKHNWPINYDKFTKYYKEAYQLFGLDEVSNFNSESKNNYYTYQYLRGLFENNSSFIPKTFLQSSEKNRDLTNIIGKKIINSNNVHLITNATALDFSVNSQGLANQLLVSTLNLKQHNISAKNYVLCMGAIEGTRFILNSKIKKFIKSENLGKGFMSHPGFGNVAKIYLQNNCINNKNYNQIKNNLKYFTAELNNKIKNDEKILGHGFSFKPIRTKTRMANKEFNEILNNLSYLNVFDELKCIAENGKKIPNEWSVSIGIEQEFLKKNYIKLSNNNYDIFRKPTLEIFWDNISNREIKTIHIANQYLSRQLVLSNLGILKISKKTINNEIFRDEDSINHHIGMTNMSKLDTDGIVDSNLKIHGIKNVYISSSSVFPSSSNVNPTLTISALSLRLADYLAEKI